MENLNDYMIIPPHLNAEAYRNDTSGNGIASYLDYIKINPGNKLTSRRKKSTENNITWLFIRLPRHTYLL